MSRFLFQKEHLWGQVFGLWFVWFREPHVQAVVGRWFEPGCFCFPLIFFFCVLLLKSPQNEGNC